MLSILHEEEKRNAKAAKTCDSSNDTQKNISGQCFREKKIYKYDEFSPLLSLSWKRKSEK